MSLAVEHRPTLDSVNPWSWWTTARRIRRFAPDLVLFSWWHPFFAPSFGSVARLSGSVPRCYLCHNVLPHEASLVDRLLLRYAFSSGDRFITHSSEDRKLLESLRPGARVLESPHPTYEAFATDTGPARDEARQELGLGDKRVLLFFGFVRRYKGLDVLLDAAARLDPERYHLLVVGEFYDDRSRYAEALAELERRGQLTLVDRYAPNEEIPLYFRAADLTIVPYKSATQSGIVQMAYAFDLPVVATRVGGLPEVVREGQTGFLVPPADAAALADAVESYFRADPAPFRAAIEREKASYSWSRMVDTIESIVR